MIFAMGTMYPTQEQGRLLAGLEGELAATLARGTPPRPETVISACEELIQRAMAGGFYGELAGLGLDVHTLKGQMNQAVRLMGRASLEAKVALELGADPWTPRTLIPPQGGRPITRRLAPLGVLFHIAAGNVDGLPAFSLVEGLLAGNINLLKLPQGDNGLSLAMAQALVGAQPSLAPYVYVFDTPSQDLTAMEALAALADGIVTWGGDGATTAVRKLAPAGVKLIEWGHKLSFAYATPGGLTPQNLADLARHVVETGQLLCSSCQTLFVEGDGEAAARLCRKFLPILEGAVARAPSPDVGSRAQATLALYTQTLERAAGHTTRKVFRGKGCSLTLCEGGGPELSLQFGNLLVKPVEREELVALLRREKTHLQTAGLLCTPEEGGPLTNLLFRAGVTRVTPPGEMSHTTALDAHDGESPLRRYTRVVEETGPAGPENISPSAEDEDACRVARQAQTSFSVRRSSPPTASR